MDHGIQKQKKNKNKMYMLCCKAIVKGNDEALMCEGEICREVCYCTEVTATHYKLLEKSPEPLRCHLCMHLKHAAIMEEMKSVITNQTAEVAKLRAALQSATRIYPRGQVQISHEAQNGRKLKEMVRHETTNE